MAEKDMTELKVRLAMRQQEIDGEQWWIGYMAPPDSMDDTVELGRIRMSIVMEVPGTKDRFINLMSDSLRHMLAQAMRVDPKTIHMPEPTPAPEHER